MLGDKWIWCILIGQSSKMSDTWYPSKIAMWHDDVMLTSCEWTWNPRSGSHDKVMRLGAKIKVRSYGHSRSRLYYWRG